MAGRRKYFRRRRRARKGPSLAKRVNALARKLRPEKKWNETIKLTSQAIGTSTASPLDLPILNLANGNTQHDRIGNRVKITGIYGKYMFKKFSNAENALFRVVMYIPRNSKDTLKDHGGTGIGVSYTDQIDADRYSVLMDRTVNVQTLGDNTEAYYKPFTIARKFNITQHYSNHLAGTWSKNCVRLYIVSTSGTSISPLLDGYSKVYYTDV